jgi:hypothetical protein
VLRPLVARLLADQALAQAIRDDLDGVTVSSERQ